MIEGARPQSIVNVILELRSGVSREGAFYVCAEPTETNVNQRERLENQRKADENQRLGAKMGCSRGDLGGTLDGVVLTALLP